MFELNIVGNFPTDDTGMFDQKDTTLINSLTWQERVRKLYANCSVPINVTLLGIDMDSYCEKFIGAHYPPGKNRYENVVNVFGRNSHTLENRFKNYISKEGIVLNEGRINVYLTNNEAVNNRIPLTPWTLGHRAAHALMGHDADEYAQPIFKEMLFFFDQTMKIREREDVTRIGSIYDESIAIFTSMGTFRSCREGKIRSPLEFLMECMTQYLISGWVDINAPVGINDEEEQEWNMKLNDFNMTTLRLFFQQKNHPGNFYVF